MVRGSLLYILIILSFLQTETARADFDCARVSPDEWMKQTEFHPLSSQDIVFKILNHAAQPNKAKKPKAVIFDIDETLIETTPRAMQGMKKWAETKEANAFPEVQGRLRRLTITQIRYDETETLAALGLNLNSSEVKTALPLLRRYWRDYYFSNEGISNQETAYPGAFEFIKALLRLKVKIYFITGRNHETMREGTIQQLAYRLNQHGIDIESPYIDLKLRKKVQGQQIYTSTFKEMEFRSISQEYEVLAILDNDIWNLESANRAFAKSETMIVFVDTSYPNDRYMPLKGIYRITNGNYLSSELNR